MNDRSQSQQDMIWVFGYGSLTWKADFPYHERVVGHVKGYARRFWQGSTDHRGIPGAPGRVVTLVEAQEEVTWGVAFSADRSILPHLDYREKDGYTVHSVTFHPYHTDSPPFPVLVYIATQSNIEYLGPASLDDIARQVAESRGPSGCNVEYVLNLACTVRETFPHAQDSHLFGLEDRLREMLSRSLSHQNPAPLVCDSCEYHSPLVASRNHRHSKLDTPHH